MRTWLFNAMIYQKTKILEKNREILLRFLRK